MDSNRLKVRFPLVNCVIVGKPVGETILYFGCRYEHLDFIYEDELQKYQDAGKISSLFILNSNNRGRLLRICNFLYIFAGTLKLYVAHSRVGPEKVYVQHLLKQNADEVWKLLDEGGHLYVCG